MGMPALAYLSLGSNTSPLANLARAVALLQSHCNIRAASSVYCTEAQDQPPGTADYYNMALAVETALAPAEFKRGVLRPIEEALGRRRDAESRAMVPIDLDITLWGDAPLEYGDKPWRTPSPDLLRYAHVAVPLAEIAPDRRHPETGETLADIAARLGAGGIRRLGPLAP